MSKCICERSCGENRTDPDCPVCNLGIPITKSLFAKSRSETIVDSYPIKDGIDVHNIGHGWVWPRADGNVAKCGATSFCGQCKHDQARKNMSVNPTYEVTYAQLAEKLDKAVSLLSECAKQFRYYERNHREKMTDPSITKEKLLETFEKAEANASLAKVIEEQLDEFQNR